MQTFLDGQVNLAGLSVPGVYDDIILPTPFLVGTPTNIEAFVGVGSWGPVDGIIPGTNLTDVSLSVGPPKLRQYDLASAVDAATQEGNAIGFKLVRVTDGTDTAASATIQSSLTLTGKYTGTLGNGIQSSIVQGTQAGSYMVIVSFPGMPPEQFNNIAGPVAASGSATFSGQPTANDTLTIAGTAITFVASGATGLQVNIGASLAATLSNLLTFLQASQDTGLSKCTYSVAGSKLIVTANQFVNSGANAGTGGNALALAKTSTSITLSGSTLSGGTGTWQTFWTNAANAINNGTQFHGPSAYVIASSETSTAAPTLATPVQLSGGTDGDAGVTDATLVGQDVLPRKGMYVLRSNQIDCFALVDHSTIADWGVIGSFALSENCYPIVSTASGTSYAQTISDRVAAGADTNWLKICTGDWPSYYDAFNGVTRLMDPAVMAVGIFGNLSPQQSSLNKRLAGVTSTETSTLGQTYGTTDLSLINQGGIDTILPASQSPGGNYYSFATGRNASSNTAANGDEYTRMTNFMARTFQQKAAGSFIGRLQSIQPNDQTRSDAKALFDGFLQQLADPQSGLGINGQGMIDAFATQCDLNNNPPDLQAKGYLFIYVQVRYLNVIRYFVVKFQGGGNVTVSVNDNAPVPAQLAA